MKGGVAQRARRRSAMAHRWSMRLASSRRSRRSSAGCRGRSSSSGTGEDAAARGGRGWVMESSFFAIVDTLPSPLVGEGTRMAAAPFGGRLEGWAERRADARSVMCITVSTPTDAPRGRASTSSGQAPVLSATPGARGGRGPACDRPPGTVRVTPATLAGTSLTDGSNAPSPGSVGSLLAAAYRPSGYLRPPKQPAPVGWQAGRQRRRSPALPPFASWTARRAPPDAPLGSRSRPAAATDAARSDKNPAPSAPAARKVAGLTSPPCDGTRAGWHGGEVGRKIAGIDLYQMAKRQCLCWRSKRCRGASCGQKSGYRLS